MGPLGLSSISLGMRALLAGGGGSAVTGSFEVPAGGSGSAGFTNTGLAYDGTNLLIGDYTNSRIVKTSTAGAYVGEILLAGAPATSVQGVAYDSSDGSYWVCHYAATNGTIRRYNAAGALQQTISPALAVGGPNGCAYDASLDRIIAVFDDGIMREFNAATGSATPAASVTLDAALGTGSGTGPDGIALDPDSPASFVWISADTTPTRVHKINRSTGASVSSFVAPMSVEGVAWVGSTLHVCCDAGFHASIPNGNRVYKFTSTGAEVQGFAFNAAIVNVDLSGSTGQQIVTGVGFRPRVIIALGDPTIGQQATAQIAVGAADTAGNQWAFLTRWNDADATAPIVVSSYQTNRIISRYFGDGTAAIDASFTDAHHDGFRLNVTVTSVTPHRASFLCLGGDSFSGRVGTFDITTAGGTQAVTGVGFTPKAVLVCTVKGNTTPGVDSTGTARITYGAMTASGQWGTDAVAGASVAQVAIGSSRTNAAILRTLNSTTESMNAGYSSFDADGFTVTKTTPPGTNITIGYVALGGASMSAAAGVVVQPAATGAQSVTGLAFQPKALLFGGNSAAALGPGAIARPVFGMATATSQMSMADSATDGANPTQAGRVHSESAVIQTITGTGTTVTSSAALTSINTDGFSLNWTAADATARQNFYLALG